MDLLARIREDMAHESNIWKSFLYRFLMEFQLWWPIWVVYLQLKRGLSLTQITLMDAPFFVLIVLAEVPTGAVADRFGRRFSLMLGSSLFAVAVFIFAIADNYPVLLLSYGTWGLALTFQNGADIALLYDSLQAVGREDSFQKINSRLTALRSLSVLLAIIIGAPIAEATNFQFPMILSAGIALLAVPVAFSMHESKRGAHEPDRYVQTLITGIRDVWRHAPLRNIIFFSGVIWAGTFTPLIFQQPLLHHYGVGTGNLGLWQAPVRGAGVVAALLAYQFVARMGQRGGFLALPVLLIMANLTLAGVDRGWAAAAFLGIGLTAGMQMPIVATYVNNRIPSERRATILSVQSVVASGMLAICEPIGGIVADQLGLRAMFLLFALMTATFAFPLLFLWHRAEREQTEREALSRELLGHEREAVAV